MLGRNDGWVTTQGEILADLFGSEGWTVRETSSIPSRPLRLVDTVSCLLRWRRSIDVVVLSVFSGPAFVMADLSSLLARWLRLPIVMVLHGGNLPEHARSRPRWTRRVLARAHAIIAPSAFLADVRVVGDQPVTVIPNVVDLSGIDFHPRSRLRPRVLWMRTFHPVYNPSMAVRAVAQLQQRAPDAILTMAGQEKGLTDATRTEADTLCPDGSVRFTGFLDRDGKRLAFNDHDIFVNTNRVDNTPVSVIEAAAAGLPIVATAVGGIPDLLTHEQTALLVPDDDDAAMADALERLLNDPELAARLSVQGRQLAEQSAWPAVRDRWIPVLLDVARSVPRRREDHSA